MAGAFFPENDSVHILARLARRDAQRTLLRAGFASRQDGGRAGRGCQDHPVRAQARASVAQIRSLTSVRSTWYWVAWASWMRGM
jgi:hypothetical protein